MLLTKNKIKFINFFYEKMSEINLKQKDTYLKQKKQE